jgi:hypothetical protein
LGIGEEDVTPFRPGPDVYIVRRLHPGFPSFADLKVERRIEQVGDVDACAERPSQALRAAVASEEPWTSWEI